jgi:death-on-curing protein
VTAGFLLPPLRALIDIHAELLLEHGGAPGLRDAGGLEASLARPLQITAYAASPRDIFDFGTALCAGLCRIHHPFVDGNKRVALAGLGMVLLLNGVFLDAREVDAAEQVLRLASGEIDEAVFANWLRTNSIQGAEAP